MFNFLKLHLMYVHVYTFYQKLKMQSNVYISVKTSFPNDSEDRETYIDKCKYANYFHTG